MAEDNTISTENETGNCCCCFSDAPHKKERSGAERRDMINRLSRIEGQIRGLKRMVEENCYCPDILIQAAAANAALKSFSTALLSEHIRTCVSDGVKRGDNDKIEELVALLQKMIK